MIIQNEKAKAIADLVEKADIESQYRYGVYAGRMCKECAIRKFRDNCGHRPEGQGGWRDLDEQYWEE